MSAANVQPLTGHIEVTGVGRTLADLQAVSENIRELSQDLIETARTAGAVAMVGVAIGAVSVAAQEAIQRSRQQSAVALGVKEAQDVIQEIEEITRGSRRYQQVLTDIGTAWAAIGQISQLTAVSSALVAYGNAGGFAADQLQRLSEVMLDIQRSRVVTQSQLDALRSARVPTGAVAREMGLSSDRQLIGKSSDQVVPALTRVLRRLEGGRLLTDEIRDVIAEIRNGLAPTGALLSQTFMPVVSAISATVQLFGQMNAATGGVLGALLVIAPVMIAMKMAAPVVLELMTALKAAGGIAALTSGASLAGMGSIARVLAVAWAMRELAPELKALMDAVASAVRPIVDVLAPVLQQVAEWFRAINDYLGGWPAKVLAVVILLQQALQIMTMIRALNLVEMWANIVAFARQYLTVQALLKAAEKARLLINAALAALSGNWAGLAVAAAILGGAGLIWAANNRQNSAEGGGSSGDSPGDTPNRRSAAENYYYRNANRGMGVS